MSLEDAAKQSFALGTQAAKVGDYAGANSHFSQGLDTANSVEIKSALLVSRTGALGALGRWAEALVDAEAVRVIRPSWSRTFECRAACLHGLGRTKEADAARQLSIALASLKADPKNEVVSQCVYTCRIHIDTI